ncbi:MAG: hypothetical protein ONB51_01665 [candidate division KSB1 bacterium]|nr:hypothetical protein [candidate division KSB1 bacterium]MDZ7407928.1 hypothetical protein [candidate division KSB1 bacterium]
MSVTPVTTVMEEVSGAMIAGFAPDGRRAVLEVLSAALLPAEVAGRIHFVIVVALSAAAYRSWSPFPLWRQFLCRRATVSTGAAT